MRGYDVPRVAELEEYLALEVDVILSRTVQNLLSSSLKTLNYPKFPSSH